MRRHKIQLYFWSESAFIFEYVLVFSYLCVSVAQFLVAGSLVQLRGVLQDFHDGQEIAAVLGPFIRGESQP